MSTDCSLSDRSYVTPLILAMLSFLFSIMMGYAIYKTIDNFKHSEYKPPKFLFIVELSFVSISSITMNVFSILLIISIIHCHGERKRLIKASNYLFSISYGFQIHCLHLLWLSRLKFVFEGSVYKISSFIYHGYMICLFIAWICTMLLLILRQQYLNETDSGLLESRWFVYGALYALSAAFLMILFFIFIYKLHSLHKETNDGSSNNTDLLSAITKNIILAFISISCTWILSLVMIITATKSKVNTPIEVAYTLILVDIVTNAICVMLTYNYYENTYYRLCGYIDNKCKSVYIPKSNQANSMSSSETENVFRNMVELNTQNTQKKMNENGKLESPIIGPSNHETVLKQLSVASILRADLSKSKSKDSRKMTATRTSSEEDIVDPSFMIKQLSVSIVPIDEEEEENYVIRDRKPSLRPELSTPL